MDYFTDQLTSDFSLHHNMTLSLNIVFFHPFLQVAALLHALTTVHHNKRKKAHTVQHTKHKEFLQQKKKQEEAKLKRHKEARKKLYRVMGQMDQKRQRSSLKGAPHDDWLPAYGLMRQTSADCDWDAWSAIWTVSMFHRFGRFIFWWNFFSVCIDIKNHPWWEVNWLLALVLPCEVFSWTTQCVFLCNSVT